jgi:cyclohexadieny/prephenate dehydrogenase
MLFDQITIVGVGLIGGSVGLAAKARGVARRVVGVGRDPANLQAAVRRGAIDRFTTDQAEGVRGSSLVVFCTPVDRIADQVIEAANHCEPGTLLSDAGSTKAQIVRQVDRHIRDGVHFVGAHPIAGSEKRGVEHSRVDLFVDRVTIVTPSTFTDESAQFNVMDFWAALGSRVVTMNPETHDEVVAEVSHLPHVVAAAVAGATDVDLLPVTGGGFRDVTRIAAGDPWLWAAIFEANRDAVLTALRQFTTRLDEFRRMLEAGDRDGLVRWLSEGKQVRDALGTGNPPEGA